MSESDHRFLLGYGLTTLIDLRSADEINEKPNPFKDDPHVDYFNIPLIEMDMSALISNTASDENSDMFRLSDLYISIIENSKGAMKNVFDVLSSPRSACTLFHCTAGKDRTGIIAAMLLSLAGVALEDILSNYEITNTHLRKVYGKEKRPGPSIPVSLIESDPVNIEVFIKHIEVKYGGTENYLISIGVPRDRIMMLKNKFMERAYISE
jgi:protein-tyrosine phosphatase